MKLCIGVIGNDLGFISILRQHGIPFQEITDDTLIEYERFPIISICTHENISQEKLLAYVRSGGIVIISSRIYAEIFNCSLHKDKVSFQIFDSHIFEGIGLVDFNTNFSLAADTKITYPNFMNSIGIREHGKGMMCVLPFDLIELLSDSQKIRKKFYAERKELPSEIVSKVSKGKISLLIFRTLVYLFNVRGLPFVHEWYYPDGVKNLFAFRIDTDFCNERDAQRMHEIFIKYKINATWFVDTKSKSMLAGFYAHLQNQEIGLHCDTHTIFDDYQKDFDNVKEGLNKLHEIGLGINGFAAPFGEWSPELDKILNELSFKYSSDFVFDYDDFPTYSILENKFSQVLQIPIHPVSIGRLRRSHFSDEEMIDYYLRVIQRKINENQPIILYHHPHHQRWGVLETIFDYVNDQEIWKPTFFEFYQWWNERLTNQIEADFKEGILNIQCKNKRIHVRVIHDNDQYSVIKPKMNIKLRDIKWEKQKNLPIPSDIARIRKKHWRDILYNYETRKAKYRVIK
jgi:hypothetical protein